MVICLGWPSPATSSSLPAATRLVACARTRGWRCGTHLAAYLALLRLGVAVPSLLPAPRWALTPPFHPYPSSLLALGVGAVCFLLPCPSPCGAQALPGSLPDGARTFLAGRAASRRYPRDHRTRPVLRCALNIPAEPLPRSARSGQPGQAEPGLVEIGLESAVGIVVLCQYRQILLPRLRLAAKLLQYCTTQQPGPSQQPPPDIH